MTVEAFLALPEIKGRKRELIHGVVYEGEIDIAGAWLVHETVKSNANGILAVWLANRSCGKLSVHSGCQLDGVFTGLLIACSHARLRNRAATVRER